MNMVNVKADVVKTYPFVNNIPRDGRIIIGNPYYDSDDSTFKLVSTTQPNTWLYAEPIQMIFWSKKEVDSKKDFFSPIIHTLFNNYSYDDIIKVNFAIVHDIYNMSVIIDKYLFYNSIFKEKKDTAISEYLLTDLEYFFGLIRSYYDNLNILIMRLHYRNTKIELKDSYAKMIEKTEEQLLELKLPTSIADFYLNNKDIFLNSREIRDNIYHRGYNIPQIFCSPDGFSFSKFNPTDSLTKSILKLDLWKKEDEKNMGLISILPIISYLTKHCIDISNNLESSLNELYPKPIPISNDYKIFIRSYFSHHLKNLENYCSNHWL